MSRDLTTGSVFKNLIHFCIPYLFSYFLQTLYGMADLFIIGQFCGVESTTAVSIGSQVMHMITVIIVGLAMGTTVTIGQAIGAKDHNKASKYVGNSITLFVLFSLVLTVILCLSRYGIVSVMSTPAEAISGTVSYLTICFIGIPFITAYNIISSIFRGLGDSKRPMYFVMIACVLNIVLDYLFIGYFHLGPSGAALGTTISQASSVLISLLVIRKMDTGIKLKRNDLKVDHELMQSILKIGCPIAVQDGLIQVAFIIITVIANKRGLNDSAAVGIVEKCISFIFLVPSSMLSTVSALGAQNIGAGQKNRAKETLYYAIGITVIFGLIMGLIMQVAAENVVSLFTDSRVVIMLGGQYLKGYIWDTLFAGIHFSFSGYFCACGKSIYSFIHNIIAIALVRVPLVYLASVTFTDTLYPMGLATSSGSLLSSIICVILFVLLNKKDKQK